VSGATLLADVQPLFLTGTARGGTTLPAQMLSAGRGASVASDPFFPLLRSLRNALLRDAGVDTLPPGAPLQDYYFADERLRWLDAVQSGSLDVPVDADELDDLRARVAARAAVEAPRLVPLVGRLGGATYRELVASAVAIVAETMPTERYAGTKEVWGVEFVPHLARAFRDARFVLVVRDPRAVVVSLVGMARRDPTQAAHPLSYLRHWRKQIAFTERLSGDAELAPRVRTLVYERLVREPEAELRSLCEWLGIEFEEAMLAPAWGGNSSFGEQRGVDPAAAERWRERLSPELAALTELVCGPDLALAGYEPLGARDDDAALAHLRESDGWTMSWRSDLGDPERDLAAEQERLALLERGAAGEELRRAFLFPEAYAALRARRPVAA
jgi:hypothetical protein